MSDEVSVRCTQREVFSLIFANTDIREPVHTHQMQWMAHWSQASSSSSFQSRKHCAFTNAINNRVEEHCYLPVDTVEQSYTYVCKNDVTYDLGKHNSTSYALQTAKSQGGDNGRFSVINNPIIRNKLDSFCSEPKMPVSSMNLENSSSYQFQNSTGLTPEWNHFPMFEINRKMGSIMASKRRTILNAMEAKMNEQLLPLRESPVAHQPTQFASEGHQRQQQDITETYKETSWCESEEGALHHNCDGPKVTSNMPSYKENDLSCSGLEFKEHFANANLSYFKHGLRNSTKNSTIMASEMKHNNLGCSGSSRTRLKNGSSSCSDAFGCPFLAEEHSKQREAVFGGNKGVLGLSELNEMSNCSTIGCRKGECQKFSNSTPCLLPTKEVAANLHHNDRSIDSSSVSAKVKEKSLFEKLTVPIMLHDDGQRKENSQIMVSTTNDMVGVEGTDTQLVKKEKENMVETNIRLMDVDETLSFLEVGNFSESHEVPPVDVNRNTMTSEVEDSNSSRTGDVWVKKPSNPPTESTERFSDPNSKWVKRLRPHSLDSIPLSTKRFKKGETCSSEMKILLSRVVNYNRTICDLPESSRDWEKVTPWIRRWCKSSTSKATDSPKETPVLCEPENSKVITENFEARQFPSLAAMALMGKQVTNYRPCEFRKRGSTIIWNI